MARPNSVGTMRFPGCGSAWKVGLPRTIEPYTLYRSAMPRRIALLATSPPKPEGIASWADPVGAMMSGGGAGSPDDGGSDATDGSLPVVALVALRSSPRAIAEMGVASSSSVMST